MTVAVVIFFVRRGVSSGCVCSGGIWFIHGGFEKRDLEDVLRAGVGGGGGG